MCKLFDGGKGKGGEKRNDDAVKERIWRGKEGLRR